MNLKALLCAGSGLLVTAGFGVSCSPAPQSEPEQVQVFTGHQFLAVATPTKSLGENCTEGGRSDCKGKGAVCFHYRAEDPKTGYVCSVPCSDDSDCPEAWACVSIVPSVPGNAYCAPPKVWMPAKASIRQAAPQALK